jgi:Sigma-54 interaction domain
MTTDLVDPVDRCARRVSVPGGEAVVDSCRSALGGGDPFALARGDSGILETRSEDGEASLSMPDHPAKEVGAEGTGKQPIARAIHRRSPRSEHSIVGMNCAETPASLITTRSFGHERGAFTGPLQRPPGHFELAAWRDAIPRQGRVGKRLTERLKRDHGRLRPAPVRDC